jgi:1-deoxy-D-xylulose-5-phosphate synthase
VVNCRFLKPFDEVTLTAILGRHKYVLVVEEATVVNGFGAYMSTIISQIDTTVRVATHGVPDRIIEQASRKRQLEQVGLDSPGIARRVRALRESEAVAE